MGSKISTNFAVLLRGTPPQGDKGDSLAQLVEHNTFNVGVLGSSPRRITENKRKIKQIPDNQTLSGISFFWQVAENSRFKHIIGG